MPLEEKKKEKGKENMLQGEMKMQMKPERCAGVKWLKIFEGQAQNSGFDSVSYQNSLKLWKAASGQFTFKMMK